MNKAVTTTPTNWVGSTFSPMMIHPCCEKAFVVREITRDEFEAGIDTLAGLGLLRSCVGHENTAELMTRKFGAGSDTTIPFNRVDVMLSEHDTMLIACPQFRDPRAAREFSDEEIARTSWRFFHIAAE